MTINHGSAKIKKMFVVCNFMFIYRYEEVNHFCTCGHRTGMIITVISEMTSVLGKMTYQDAYGHERWV